MRALAQRLHEGKEEWGETNASGQVRAWSPG
jgi:hypothetical protein